MILVPGDILSFWFHCLGYGFGDWHLCKHFRCFKNADKVAMPYLYDFPCDMILRRKCMRPKNILLVTLVMGKLHRENTGRKYTKILTMIQIEVSFLGGSGFLCVFFYIVVMNIRPQTQMYKKRSFIFIYYMLIFTVSPTLLVVKTFRQFRGTSVKSRFAQSVYH